MVSCAISPNTQETILSLLQVPKEKKNKRKFPTFECFDSQEMCPADYLVISLLSLGF